MLNERCGLILEGEVFIEIENIHPEPARFLMFEEQEMRRDGIIGTWHTHPNTSPNLSVEDYRWFTSYPELNHFIISTFETWRYYVENGALLVSHNEDHLLTRIPERSSS